MARRWTCPRCGSGCNAPERPRRDDVRRYCLDCSRVTGRLVERTCPALERERAEKAERVAARRSTKAERDRAEQLAARSYNGLDLDREARRLWNLPIMREHHKGRKLPELVLRRRSQGYHSGHASTNPTQGWGSRRVVLTLGRGCSTSYTLSYLLHELAHCAAWGHGHDETWAACYLGAARQGYGEAHFTGRRVPSGGGYATDPIVEAGIAASLAVAKAAALPEATGRAESDPCEAGTVGCSVDHGAAGPDSECATW